MYLTIRSDRVTDERIRTLLEAGEYLDDDTLDALERIGEHVRAPEVHLTTEGVDGWYLDEDGHSHYIPAPDHPELHLRAITQRQAEHIGMAAAMAGGYVAVDGPRVERIDRDAYRAIVEDAENDAVRWRREDARRLAAAYHELPSGDYVRIVSPGGCHDHLILVIPPDNPLAEYGYALPPSVVRDLIPLLAGYDTGGEVAEVVEA